MYYFSDYSIYLEQRWLIRSIKYSRTSIARTSMARLPWLIRTRFRVPTNFSVRSRKQIFREIFVFYQEIVYCLYSIESPREYFFDFRQNDCMLCVLIRIASSIFNKMIVCCVYSLESHRRGDSNEYTHNDEAILMSTHNIQSFCRKSKKYSLHYRYLLPDLAP